MKKLIRIKQIKITDEGLYPRIKYSWHTSYDYAESMKSGAKFPNIVVAILNNKYVLVDGRHTLEAYKLNKQEFIQAEVLTNLSKKEIYLMAVKRNLQHGRQFSIQEKVNIIHKFKKMGYSFPQVSKMIQIPLDKIEKFYSERITNTVEGLFVPLKSPSKSFAGMPVPEDFNKLQDSFTAHSQIHILDQFISLLENKMIDLKNPRVKIRLQKIIMLIKKITKKV